MAGYEVPASSSGGAAYVFARQNDGFWHQTARLQPYASFAQACSFGRFVSIHYDRIAAVSACAPCRRSVSPRQRRRNLDPARSNGCWRRALWRNSPSDSDLALELRRVHGRARMG